MFSDNTSNIFSQGCSQQISFLTQKGQEKDKLTVRTPGTSRPNPNNLSEMIDNIFEENHKLGGMVTSSLQSLDKFREKLIDQLKKTDLQLKESEEIHEEQKKRIIDLQMQNESFANQYQHEVTKENELIDKVNYSNEIVNLLSYHQNITSDTIQNLQDDQKAIKEGMSEALLYLKQLQVRSRNDNNNFQTQRDMWINKTSTLQIEIRKDSNVMTDEIVKNRQQLVELSERKQKVEQQLNIEIHDQSQLSEKLRDLTIECDSEKDCIAVLKQKFKGLEKKKNEDIPKLNLMINTSRNELSNITNIYEANEKYLAELKVKNKQVVAKVRQLEASAVESRQCEFEIEEKIICLSEKTKSLITKKKELQSELIRRQNVQSEVIRLRNIWEEKKSFENGLTNKINNKRKTSTEVNNKLITMKKEIEAIADLTSNYHTNNNELQKNSSQLELAMHEVKKLIQNKQQAITEALNCQKEKAVQQRLERDKLKTILNQLKRDVVDLVNENETFSSLYRTKKRDLEVLKSKLQELHKKLEGDFKIYDVETQDIKSKINDLENKLVEKLEELEDLPYLKERKEQIKATMKDKDAFWINENNKAIYEFDLQIKDLEKERTLYQANFDAISKKEEDTLSEVKTLISNKKEFAVTLDKTLHDYKMELTLLKEKETEYQTKISLLEDKLRKVSQTAKVTRKDITSAFAPSKPMKERGYKPTSVLRKQSEIKHGGGKEVSTKQHEENLLMTPTSSVELDFNIQHKKNKSPHRPLKKAKIKDPFDFTS